MKRNLRGPFLIVLALLTFLPFIGQRDIVTSHEARVVQVSRQMAEVGWPWNARRIEVPQVEKVMTPNGERLRPLADGSTISVNPWLIPVISGAIRLQKPPLPYWCSATLLRLVGFGEGVSRITPAVFGALAILLIWDLGRILLGSVGGWYAALVWVSSYFIVDEFRKTMADPYLAFFTLAATWAWIRAARSRQHSTPLLLLCYICLAMAMLAKGPLIFAFVPVMVAAYHICYRVRLPGKAKVHLAGAGLFLLVSLPWYIYASVTIPHALELWRYESVGELSDNVEKARGWWFYLPNLLMISLPWTPLWLLGLVYPLRFPGRRRRYFATACTVAIVLIFSISNVKKNAYLLPMMPIQTLVIAQGLLWLTVMFRPNAKHRPVRVPLTRTTVLAVCLCIAVQIFVSGFLVHQDNQRSPKLAARFVQRSLDESPADRSLLVSMLPEEASVYMHLNERESPTASEYWMITDDRKGLADSIAASVQRTPAGPVESREEIDVPNARSARWKVFKLLIQRPPGSAAAATQPVTQAATSPAMQMPEPSSHPSR